MGACVNLGTFILNVGTKTQAKRLAYNKIFKEEKLTPRILVFWSP
jgi:hypothetical protein